MSRLLTLTSMAVVVLSAFVLLAVSNTAHAQSCYSDPTTTGFQFPVENLENTSAAYGLCKEGWYCPFYDPANISGTWPRICPASDSCVEQRINTEFCEPQGPLEPTPCKSGFYCPVSNQMLPCPKGHWCPMGCTEPHKCSPFASCPEGTGNEYDMVGIFFLVVVDILIVVCFAIYRRQYRASVQKDLDELAKEEEMAHVSTGLEEGGKNGGLASSNSTKNLDPLFSLFSKAKDGGSSIAFGFSNLSVKIPAKEVIQPAGGANSSSPTSGSPAVTPAAGSPVNTDTATLPNDGNTKPEDKTLLRGVNGKFRPGTVTAVMGPSGAGKTVLLNTLLNKNPASWKQEGDLKVNHTLNVTDVRHVVGYVPQDDILHTELTVDQNLFYSSETRLPPSFTTEDKDLLRSEIVKGLDLSVARHVQIGDESSRGVSGGQRKRCSIGVELAACPTALFLDEPTTGLDAATALDLCSLLQRLSVGTDSTIVMVVHQPRIEIWNALDQVLLLAPGGRTVFQGAQADAKAYFQGALGLNFELGNPADIIIDGIAAQADLAVEMWDARMQMEENGGSAAVDVTTVPAVAGGNNEVHPLNSSVPPSPHSTLHHDEEGTVSHFPAVIPPPRGASFGKQVYLASHRLLVKINANYTASIMDVLLGTVCCVVMATAQIRQDYAGIVDGAYALVAPKHTAYTLPMLFLFYALAAASGVAPGGIRTFGSAMPMYWREASNGHSKLAYFLGYSLVDLLRSVVSSLHFTVVAYLMAQPLQSFWTFWVWMILLFIIVDSQSAALSMFLKPDTAPILSTIVAIFMGLMNGYAAIPLIGPLSYAWWFTEGMLHGEMWPIRNIWSVSIVEEFAPGPFWSLDRVSADIFVMLFIYILYRVAGFVLLTALNREKQR